MPQCASCDNDAVVQWTRRPTAEELESRRAFEQTKRDVITLLADTQLPAPVFGPLPTADDVTVSVYACGAHGLPLDAASHVHASACAAPPACTCKPESAVAIPAVDIPVVVLPEGWQ
jgi:hypothetical protein